MFTEGNGNLEEVLERKPFYRRNATAEHIRMLQKLYERRPPYRSSKEY